MVILTLAHRNTTHYGVRDLYNRRMMISPTLSLSLSHWLSIFKCGAHLACDLLMTFVPRRGAHGGARDVVRAIYIVGEGFDSFRNECVDYRFRCWACADKFDLLLTTTRMWGLGMNNTNLNSQRGMSGSRISSRSTAHMLFIIFFIFF